MTLAVLLLVPAARSAAAQDTVAAGDRVRIWPQPNVRYRARVLTSWYPDSLRVFETDSAWRPAPARTNHVRLSSLTRLDIARGNHWVSGVLVGVAAALATGVAVAVVGPDQLELSPGETVLLYGGLSLVVTVPIGALVGSSYPRWSRVR